MRGKSQQILSDKSWTSSSTPLTLCIKSPPKQSQRLTLGFQIGRNQINFQNVRLSNSTRLTAEDFSLKEKAYRKQTALHNSDIEKFNTISVESSIRSPIRRLPLKVRNFDNKLTSEDWTAVNRCKTSIEKRNNLSSSFEAKEATDLNKIIEKINQQQKLITQLKKISSIALPSRKIKENPGLKKVSSLREDHPKRPIENYQTNFNSLKQNQSNICKQETVMKTKRSNPQDLSFKCAAYHTPKVGKQTLKYDTYSLSTSPGLTKSYCQNSAENTEGTKDFLRNTLQNISVSKFSHLISSPKILKPQKLSISHFILLKKLGDGKFGTVFTAIHRKTSSLFALKRIKKQTIKSHMMIDQLVIEIKVQSYCSHNNIAKLYDFFDDDQHLYLVLEYMDGGTLYDKIKKTRYLSQTETAKTIKQVVSAVKYLHDNGIAHRDIKPENVVLCEGVNKLCDFGWAAVCNDRRNTFCGTFDYAAPQILEGSQYDESVDLWCIGVLTYELLVGKPPFYHISRKETMNKIKNVDNSDLVFPSSVSEIAASFIQCLLKKCPEARMNADRMLLHPFLQGVNSND